MYLTDKKNGVVRQNDEHDELEVLLEFFAKQVEEVVNEAENIEVCLKPTVSGKTHHPFPEQCSIYPRDCRTYLGF